MSIEISERRIRVVQGALVRGREEVQKLASADILPDEDPSKALKALLEANHFQSRRAVLNIPRHLALLKFVSLPSVNPSEIGQMAKMEIVRQIPYSENEIIDTYKVIRAEDDGYSLVLLVSVLKVHIDKRVRILRNCGLKVEKVAIGAESLGLWFNENLPGLQTRDVLLATIGSDYLDLEVFESGRVVFSRGVSLAAVPEMSEDALLNEIEVSATAYQNDSSAKLDEICFMGPQPLAGRVSTLCAKMQISFHAAGLSSPSGDTEFQKDAAFAGLIGLCLRHSKIEAPLSTPDLLYGNRREELKKHLFFSLLWIVILAMFGLGWLLNKNYRDARLFSLVNAEIKKNEPRVKEVRRMKKFITEAADYLNAVPSAADVFAQIHRAAPAGVTLDLFNYEDRQKLTVRGSAAPASAVLDYSRALEKTPWLSQVRVRYVTKRLVNNRETGDFEIEAAIAGSAEADEA